MKSKSKGLGDDIQAITKATGVEKVVKAIFGEDCGCEKRKDLLNKMFPNKHVTMMNEEQKKYFKDILQPAYRSGRNLGKENAEKFWQLYEKVLGVKPQRTSCTPCVKKYYQELLKVYEGSCDE